MFFNTLVAVIGNAYNDLMEYKDRYAMLQRTRIFSDYIRVLNPKLPVGRYLYVVEPIIDGAADDEIEIRWENINKKVDDLRAEMG